MAAEEHVVFSAPSGKGGHVIAVTDQVGRVFEAHVDIVRRLRYFEAEGEPQAGDSAAAPASQLVSDAVESQVVVRVPKAAVKDATYLPANPLDAAVPGAAAVSVQWRQLCLGYHRVMCAALLLDGPLAHVAATQGRRCVVLGLGGGALPLLLHRATQMEVVAVEWDADVVSIAQTLFGVPVHGGVASGAGGGVAAGAGAAVASGHERAPDVDGGATPSPSRLLVVVQEAAAYVKNAVPLASVDWLFVDTGAGDGSALHAPASSCRTVAFLEDVRSALRPGGRVALNVLCRGAPNSAPVTDFIRTCQTVFADQPVYVLCVDDNRIVVARKTPTAWTPTPPLAGSPPFSMSTMLAAEFTDRVSRCGSGGSSGLSAVVAAAQPFRIRVLTPLKRQRQ